MFEVEDGETKRPVVTPSALEKYKDAFRELVVNYPESWRLSVFAELFAGYAGLTQAIEVVCSDSAQVRSPHDEMYGSNLRNEGEAPDWYHMAPPCRTFTKGGCARQGEAVKVRAKAGRVWL